MKQKSLIAGMAFVFSFQSVALAAPTCQELFEKNSGTDGAKISVEADSKNAADVKIALLKEPLTPDLEQTLSDLLVKNPDLKPFLESPAFIRYLQAIADGKSVTEMRMIIEELWKDPSLNDNALGPKTGALLIGPNAANTSKLIELIRKADIEKMPNDSRLKKVGNYVRRMKEQLVNLRTSLANSKQIVDAEMHPRVMDSNMFDFYGYLNLGLRKSQLREWETPPGSFGGIKLSDVQNMDPVTFVQILMMASQIEEPVNEYSDASGNILHLYPQAARFMGKTTEQADYHRKSREKLYCTNSWCEEENRHEGMLENVARRILGLVLPKSLPFSAEQGLDPFRPQDVRSHILARANTELGASSSYIVTGSHAQGTTAVYLRNIRGDELKHTTIFAGLYTYLYGNTYWSRLRGVIKKTMIEVGDKSGKSEYSGIFSSELVTGIEFMVNQIRYEKKVKAYMASLPLKTLRKIYETEINIDPLPESPMDPQKKAQVEALTPIEKARREALTNWPKKQRDEAYKLEYFENMNNIALSKVIDVVFHYFKGAEDFGNEQHVAFQNKINSLTAQELEAYGFKNLTAEQLQLVKTSLNGTMRDYQVMNNHKVRAAGLNVQFVDASVGFEIVKDEQYNKQEHVQVNKKQVADITSEAQVIGLKQATESTWIVRVQKPAGFTFKAGEATVVTLDTPQGKQSRALSMANSPNDSYLEFAVRASDSFFKDAFLKLKAGDKVGLAAPKGNLKFKSDIPAVMIAGGIGITPFRGILADLQASKAQTPVTLLYANRSENEIAFKADLDQMASQMPNLQINYTVSEPSTGWKGNVGRIDKGYLKNVVANSSPEAVYYIVAPLPMVTSVRQILGELGVPTTRIVVESFPGYR
jgi:ferredoxin-NADP reductase